MPYGLQIVDTPGMLGPQGKNSRAVHILPACFPRIDMPVKSESMAGGRGAAAVPCLRELRIIFLCSVFELQFVSRSTGYNFLEVVRWFAKRAGPNCFQLV